MALLGEMTLKRGRIIMNKNTGKVDENGMSYSISYAAQTPWLRHQSIKDNILFGAPYDEKRYNDVIDACALRPDLEMLEDGDLTEIGVRGVSLSGGQKARWVDHDVESPAILITVCFVRVALARAVYARTRYVLLDDPLSAVVCSYTPGPPSWSDTYLRIATRRDTCMRSSFADRSLPTAPS